MSMENIVMMAIEKEASTERDRPLRSNERQDQFYRSTVRTIFIF